MKKFGVFLLVLVAVLSVGTCFASSVDAESSASTDEENVQYLDSYEDYEGLISSMDDEYKNAYEEFVASRAENNDLYSRPQSYRAKVLDASAVQVYYGYYQTVYKATYQNLDIEILDGEFKGKTVEDFNYVLTVDTYENLRLREAKKGDVVNVCVYENDDGTLNAYSLGLDSTIERWPVVVCLMVIAAILVLIYLGAKGAKMIVPLVLFVDLAFLVIVPLIFEGINICLLFAALTILSAIVIALLKLGGKPAAWIAVLASLVITFVLMLAIYGFDLISNVAGITFETTSMSGVFYDLLTLYDTPYNAVSLAELVPERDVDFYSLKLVFDTTIIFFATITLVCKSVELYQTKALPADAEVSDKKVDGRFKFVVRAMRDASADRIITVVPLILTMTIPKYMLFFVNKCSVLEVLNSEILLADVTRALFVIIAIAIAAPVAAFMCMVGLDEEE